MKLAQRSILTVLMILITGVAYAEYNQAIQEVIARDYQGKRVTLVNTLKVAGYAYDCRESAEKGLFITRFETKNVIGGRYTHSVFRISANGYCEIISGSNSCSCFEVQNLTE